MTTNGPLTYTVPGMSCGHCRAAIAEEVTQVEGVRGVEIDLATKQVTVTGEGMADEQVRAAIYEAGYEVA